MKTQGINLEIIRGTRRNSQMNQSYTLRGALVCDRANSPTIATAAAARGRYEVQVTSVVGGRRTKRTRPVVAVLTHVYRCTNLQQ